MGLFSKKSAPQPSARPEYIEVGQIVNTHGVRGEVKVQPWDCLLYTSDAADE